MQPADLDQVRAIELSTSASAWSKQQLQQSLDSGHVLVAENKVLGFAIVATVLDQAELHNIAIAPALQGQGLGRQLVEALLAAPLWKRTLTPFAQLLSSTSFATRFSLSLYCPE